VIWRRLLRIEDRLGVQRVELTHDVLADVKCATEVEMSDLYSALSAPDSLPVASRLPRPADPSIWKLETA
jgi:hypothetical protein